MCLALKVLDKGIAHLGATPFDIAGHVGRVVGGDGAAAAGGALLREGKGRRRRRRRRRVEGALMTLLEEWGGSEHGQVVNDTRDAQR